MTGFSNSLELSLHNAIVIAESYSHEFATLEHLLLALLDDEDALLVFQACNVNVDSLREAIINFFTNENLAIQNDQNIEVKPTSTFQRVIQRAVIHVQSSGQKIVTGANVLVSMFSERESHAVYFLQQQNMTRLDAINYIVHGIKKNYNDDSNITIKLEEIPKKNSILDKYCTNLCQKAAKGLITPLIGRENELTRIEQTLCRRNKNNPLLVGDPGVGKTAIIEGLALKIIEGSVSDKLQDAVIYSMDIALLIAGTRYRGDYEERFNKIFAEIEKEDNAILFIDEVHSMIGHGSNSNGSIDVANLLKPVLTEGKVRCIGTTTFEEYRKFIEQDKALSRRFHKIDINEPSFTETCEIVKGIISHYEKYHHLKYSDDAIRASVELSDKYLFDRKQPDKSIDIIDEAGAFQQLQPEKAKIIERKDIEYVISKIAHIPDINVSADFSTLIKNFVQDMKRVVYGQDEAINLLSDALKLSTAGLKDKTKPIGSYLFSGPTGVGKTEVAIQLSNLLHIPLLRYDMSEYMEKHSVSRLIGSPPGYVGHEEGGLLTNAIKKSPYAVLLLDEIEKAHQDIYNILLQVMDNGELTDSHGRVASCKNLIIILTTNAGASEASKDYIGFERSKKTDETDDAIKKIFNPEFRNRLDAIIQFNNLDFDIVKKIVQKFIIQLELQLSEKNIFFQIDDKSIDFIAKKGYDRELGARPIKRVISKYIKKEISDEILFGSIKDGGRIIVEYKDGLKFNYAAEKKLLTTGSSE